MGIYSLLFLTSFSENCFDFLVSLSSSLSHTHSLSLSHLLSFPIYFFYSFSLIFWDHTHIHFSLFYLGLLLKNFAGHVKDDDDSANKKPRNLPPDGTTFNQISLGKRLEQTLPAYGYWNVQFYQMEAAFVNIDLKLPRGASLGLYARRNALPTHTNYDLMEVVKGNEEKTRTTRAVKVRKKLNQESILQNSVFYSFSDPYWLAW